MYISEEALKLKNQLKDLNRELKIERRILDKECDLNFLRRRVLQDESIVSEDKVNQLVQKIEETNRRLSEIPYNRYDINSTKQISSVLNNLDTETREILLEKLLNRLASLFDLYFGNSMCCDMSVCINKDDVKCHLVDDLVTEITGIQIEVSRPHEMLYDLECTVSLLYDSGLKTNQFANLSYSENRDNEYLTLGNSDNNFNILKEISNCYWMVEFFGVKI